MKKAESRWGSGFMKNLSRDLKADNPDAKCFSQTNLLYMKNFYLLYKPYLQITPQVGEQMESPITQQVVEQNKRSEITPQLVEQMQNDIFSVPWGHNGGTTPVTTPETTPFANKGTIVDKIIQTCVTI